MQIQEDISEKVHRSVNGMLMGIVLGNPMNTHLTFE